MRDPATTVRAQETIDELVRFFTARRAWLDPTPYDVTDIDLRAKAALHLGAAVRMGSGSGEVELRMKGTPAFPRDVREFLLENSAAVPLLPRGRGRHQAGAYGPRNVAIRQAVELAEQRGFQPKRSPATAAECGCSLVERALQRIGVSLKESTIAEIVGPQRPPRKRQRPRRRNG